MARHGTYTKKLSPLQQAKRSLKRRWVWFKGLSKTKKVLLIAGPILLFLIITPLATYAYFARDIADKDRLMNRNNTGVVLLDKDGESFFSTGRAEKRDSVTLDQISEPMKSALLASEDKDFYEHNGFSVGGIMRAVYGTVTDQPEYGGGSTLTQQLAKNTLLTADQTFMRKYQELAISIAIEQQYTKDEILEMYLNSVYYGENSFGITDAAKNYFNKEPINLTLAESSMLVGVLPAPSAYSPISGDPKLAKERQEEVLSRMVENDMITEDEKTATLAEELVYAPAETRNDTIAPHFAQMVLNELYEKYGEERVTRSGYQVRTTLDTSLQETLNTSMSNNRAFIEANGGSNSSGIAIDPTNGEVRALAGSIDWNNENFGKVNMVTTPRQPGSSFKPVYYAEALAQGIITPSTIIEDKPTDFGGYTPQNANRTFSGNITVRNALSRSLNIPAVKVMEQLGVNESIAAAKDLGITTLDNTDYGLSLALGSAEVPLIEMTNVYAAFANQGKQFDPVLVTQINNKFDDNIFKLDQSADQAISTQGAYLISSILSDQNARAPIFGNSLTVPGKTVAVKTGTTDDSRDAWTIGYTPQLALGIWVGNNDNTTMLNGGSSMAGPIWRNTMQQALANVADTSFTVPAGIVQRDVCFSNGGLANTAGEGTYKEYFLGSALPSATCRVETQQEREEKARREAEKEEREREREEREAQEEAEEAAQEEEVPVEENPNEEPTPEPGTGDEGGDEGTTPVTPSTVEQPGNGRRNSD